MPLRAKAIRRRIKSVSSTRKITKTMEMVATSKLKRAQDRVLSSAPYAEHLSAAVAEVASRVPDRGAFPLLRQADPPRATLVLVVTANRGLCGGFNGNLVRKGREAVRAEEKAGRAVILYVAGKKGLQALRFQGLRVEKSFTELSDRPTYADAERLAAALTGPFLAGEVDRVLVVYPHFKTVARQPPTVMELCPVGGAAAAAGASSGGGILFEPSAREILDALLPLYVRTMVYRVLVSAVACEQIARRTAMKLASDNAEEMATFLTRMFNKARQGQITQELAEILGGSEALKK